MNLSWRNLSLSLAFACGLATAAPACVIRAHARPAYVVEEAPPDPAPRYEHPAPRAGHVWVQGHWVYRGSQWHWNRGHWKTSRAGYHWQAGHWEQRGSRYHWIEGRWVAGGGPVRDRRADVRDHRTPPPRDNVVDKRHHTPPPRDNVADKRHHTPPPRDNVADKRTHHVPAGAATRRPPAPRHQARPAPRRGYVWVVGHWAWRGNDYKWVNGHWETQKAGYRWQRGHWEDHDDYWVWNPGKWVAN